jgi:hypothetical protein
VYPLYNGRFRHVTSSFQLYTFTFIIIPRFYWMTIPRFIGRQYLVSLDDNTSVYWTTILRFIGRQYLGSLDDNTSVHWTTIPPVLIGRQYFGLLDDNTSVHWTTIPRFIGRQYLPFSLDDNTSVLQQPYSTTCREDPLGLPSAAWAFDRMGPIKGPNQSFNPILHPVVQSSCRECWLEYCQ